MNLAQFIKRRKGGKNLLKKIVFSIICMILLVYMICPKVCSYSIEDVKKKVEFTEIPRDKEPEKYDIMIKADDLRQNEHLPLIEYIQNKMLMI